ncbi:hypothetical protein JI58_00395 [Marinosulfonomonas sp. PRT-SC04]|nr:hypothetical protein JI58_00395 [Marinosulfonomonas sp. PRT-SC04]
MFRNLLPADELAQLRTEILALRTREVELRKCFTEDSDDGFYEGHHFDVVGAAAKTLCTQPKPPTSGNPQ